MAKEKLCKLREAMKNEGIHCYLIPTSDYHDSEYISGFFRVREYFSGFTGSAGTLVVTETEAALFTDGRYFIQAEQELSGTEIKLMRMGEPGVPTIKEYIAENLKVGETLGFDGRVVKAEQAAIYEEMVVEKKGKLIWDKDLASKVWESRPPLVHQPVYVLSEAYSGESCAQKLKRVRVAIEQTGADVHVLTSLDDIAWLCNLRGNDVEYCPVVLSFAVIDKERVLLFAGDKEMTAISEEIRTYLEENHITLLPYEAFYPYVAGVEHKKVLLSLKRCSYALKKALEKQIEIIDKPNPTELMKALKNDVETENLRKAHLKDGVAVTRFMYWLKTNIGKIQITELTAAEILEQLRRMQEHFIEPSFETISAYGSNGAIIHYSASVEQCAVLEPKGLFMVDSGGHYLEGSTDITRTFVLGKVTEEMKKHFTLVLRAMLNLKNIRFLYGCRGMNLDIKAREVLWEAGLDYKHGTGHGVGYLLNVHEGPNSFRWRSAGEQLESAVLEEGMVTTDEPGIYIEGSHGIRIENELLCCKGEKNEYGQFMYFEDLTYVPIDLDGVEPKLMEEKDIRRLNEYHRQVFDKLSPYFEGDELTWLKEATRAI